MGGFLTGVDPGIRKTKTPTVNTFVAGVGFTAGSSTTIALTDSPGTEEHLTIFFDGVGQHRSTYSVSGSTVTFDTAIPTGVAEVEATYAPAVYAQLSTVSDNAIDGTKTKDALIGDYSDVTITASDLIMYGDATDSNNTKRDTVQGILDLAGGNTPAFEAYLSSDQTVGSAATYTKVAIDTEVFDSDSKYDNSTNYRFTPATAGKYFVYGQVRPKHSTDHYLTTIKAAIYLNGSIYTEVANTNASASHPYYSPGTEADLSIYTVMNLGASDYVELFGYIDEYASGTKTFATGTKSTSFGAYKLGGA